MATRKIPYFVEKPGRSGARRFYWQPKGALRELGWKAERLPDDEGAAIARARQLNAELEAWRQGKATPTQIAIAASTARGAVIQVRSVAHLIREYKASRFFTEKADKTRRGYQQNLDVIEDWAGDVPVAAIGPARVQKLYEEMREATPAKANAVVTMLRILLQHGVRLEWIKSNAAEKPGLVGLEPSGKLWPVDAVALFVECADRPTREHPLGWHSIGTAVLINHWIGQRQADVLKLQRVDYRDERFFVDQNKTGEKVAVPHAPWVAARVAAELARQADRGVEHVTHLLLCETTGQPWGEDHFRHIFAEIRARAAKKWPSFELADGSKVAMAALQFMHLRHTAVTELAIAGCTVPEIAGITGHTIKSVEQILSRYLIRTSAIAQAATDKRLAKSERMLEIFGPPAAAPALPAPLLLLPAPAEGAT